MLSWVGFLNCFLFPSFGFQPARAGGSPNRDRGSSPANAFDSSAPLPPRSSCQCTEYMSRIADLEGRLSLTKCQTKIALDKAGKSCGLMKQISILEDKVSGLAAQVTHLKECDSFLVDFVESACEQLKCRFPAGFLQNYCCCFCICL
jgi:hypothetical protein